MCPTKRYRPAAMQAEFPQSDLQTAGINCTGRTKEPSRGPQLPFLPGDKTVAAAICTTNAMALPDSKQPMGVIASQSHMGWRVFHCPGSISVGLGVKTMPTTSNLDCTAC